MTACTAPATHLLIDREPYSHVYACTEHLEVLKTPDMTYLGPADIEHQCCFIEVEPEATGRKPLWDLPDIILIRLDDGRVKAHSWPEETLISASLLENADSRHLRRAGDRVYFTVTNGEATYVLLEQTREEQRRGVFYAARLYCRLDEP